MKETHQDSETPLPFSSEEFKDLWRDWIQHRKEIKKPLTKTATKHQVSFLRGMSESMAMASIQTSIRSGWTGLFPPAKSITHCQTVNFQETGGGF
jgi:hypothetical protein